MNHELVLDTASAVVLCSDPLYIRPVQGTITDLHAVVGDPPCDRTNENGAFTASSGNLVCRAGKFYNGLKFNLALSKRFVIRERLNLQIVSEFSSVFHHANPAAVEQLQNFSIPLGKPLQYLPGREGQMGPRTQF